MLTGNAGLFLRFILSAAIGAGGALGVGALTAHSALKSAAGLGDASAYTLTGAAGGPLDFTTKPADTAPVPLQPLPPKATIQLTSFKNAVASNALQGGVRAPWWNATAPRVPPITQFDGGPWQAYNCTMAAGAMLARLGFGIVTTGSQLRALQDVQGPEGTTLANLETAVENGWSVRFFKGALTRLQLRALLFAGAGAVVQGVYGEIPIGLRLQKDFTAGHAIYLDAFRPAGPGGPAAYYVLDPIGHPWQGYQGDWWPADIVEGFGTSFGGGLIYAAWSFAGGTVPVNHPILPPSDYPGAANPFSSRPPASTSPSGEPGASGVPSPSVAASTSPVTPSTAPSAAPSLGLTNPMPPGDLSGGGNTPAGTTPPIAPTPPRVDFEANASQISPLFVHCIAQPPPTDCPPGIIGIVNPSGSAAPSPSTPPLTIHLLYANPIGPGMYQIVFQAPPNTSPELWLWPSSPGTATLEQADTESATLNGDPVSVATVTIDPTADYSFVATAAGDGIRAVSPVGSLVVGQ